MKRLYICGIALIIGLLFSACESAQASQIVSNGSLEATVSSETSQIASSKPVNNYVAGQNAIIDSSVGKYSVAIDSVKESTNRNETADIQPKHIIIVNYSYKNISCNQDITVSYLYFHVYDSNGKLLNIYPSVDARTPTQAISSGKSSTASAAYGIDDDSKQITIELYDITNPLNRMATYTADIKK